MLDLELEEIKKISDFDSLVKFLKEKLEWPIDTDDFDELTYEYDPKTLGIHPDYVVTIKSPIRQLRPLTSNQPWGIFYIEFETKKLPIVLLRRILNSLVKINRHSSNQKVWKYNELLFISAIGESSDRQITLTIFSDPKDGKKETVIKAFSWDKYDTDLHYLQTEIDLNRLHWPKDTNNIVGWKDQWQKAFYLEPREVIQSSKELVHEMVEIAKGIKKQIKLNMEYEEESGFLHELFKNFKEMLIHDLKLDEFADMYAQTVTYGLFTARITHEGVFDLEYIDSIIKFTNPFLKSFFNEIVNHDNLLVIEELGIADLVELLKKSNIEAILRDFGKGKATDDPVIHFYELFLQEYNPKLREIRGVYYTPDPVVSFIVRSVDCLLKMEFGFKDGLADETLDEKTGLPKIQILDPATGTGTFLLHSLIQMKNNFYKKYKDLSGEDRNKKWQSYVKNNFFTRITGFELLLAPYAIAHLKIDLKLKELGYAIDEIDKLRIFLSNTLQGSATGVRDITSYLNVNWLAEEASNARDIKSKLPINIVIGNPPYSGLSSNKIDYIEKLLRGEISDGTRRSSYFEIDGNKLGEKKASWIYDDYVKFIRFGQWRIDKTGYGILAFITNHGYIDNPTFRGMREQLLTSFNKIYIFDLHGNKKKNEIPPSGMIDDNVFDIQQGVSIAFFI